jgi:hypothetical protein
MRSLVLLALLFSSFRALSGDAYIIADVLKYPLESKQPTWLALMSGDRLIHIPVGKTIVAVQPGHYRIHHIDSQEDWKSGVGATIVKNMYESYDVVDDYITYIGMVQMHPKSYKGRPTEKHMVVFGERDMTLKWACASEPELLARLSVRFKNEDGSYKIVRVRCET